MKFNAVGDLIVDIDPGTDYIAEKTSFEADTASFEV